MQSSDEKKPFKVRTDAGVLRSGHDSEEQAQAACEQANEQAEALGIRTRYVTA